MYDSPERRRSSPLVVGRNLQFVAGYSPVSQSVLHSTGLRGRSLIAVVVVLAALWLLAMVTLTLNVVMMIVFGMRQSGMHQLQLIHEVNSTDSEPTVRFLAENVSLGTVVSNGGIVAGFMDTLFNLSAARILLKSNVVIDDQPVESRFALEDGRIRLDGVANLLISEPSSLRPLFSAINPDISIGSNVKKLASRQIVTNKVRAPIDKDLTFDVENMIFRGNEGNNFTAKTISFRAKNAIFLRSSANGAVRLTGKEGVTLGGVSALPLSPSPSLEANIIAFRLCICDNSDRAFVVAGNLICTMQNEYCY